MLLAHANLLDALSPLAHRSPAREGSVAAPLDLWCNDDGAVALLELPGVPAEALEVTVLDDEVTVRGRAAAPSVGEHGRWLCRETSPAAVERRFVAPFAVDAAAVEAHLAHGVLRLTLPRAASSRPHRVAIG